MSKRLVAVYSTFSEPTDPRIKRTRRHELFEVLVVALCGTIAGTKWGAKRFLDMERLRSLWRTNNRLQPCDPCNGPPSPDLPQNKCTQLDRRYPAFNLHPPTTFGCISLIIPDSNQIDYPASDFMTAAKGWFLKWRAITNG